MLVYTRKKVSHVGQIMCHMSMLNQHFHSPWVDSSQHSSTMPPAIDLPQLQPELKRIVKYPTTAPATLPTIADVAGGMKLSHEMYSAHCQSLPQPHRWRILDAFSREMRGK